MSVLPETHRKVVHLLQARLQDAGIVWALTGSASFALQGLPLTPHDIDVQTNAQGAYAIERLFREYVVRPVAWSEGERTCSHLGALAIDDVAVEIMGDVRHRNENGGWEDPPDLEAIIRFVDMDGAAIPVLALEHEVGAYRRMGRARRAEEIATWLRKSQNQGIDET